MHLKVFHNIYNVFSTNMMVMTETEIETDMEMSMISP